MPPLPVPGPGMLVAPAAMALPCPAIGAVGISGGTGSRISGGGATIWVGVLRKLAGEAAPSAFFGFALRGFFSMSGRAGLAGGGGGGSSARLTSFRASGTTSDRSVAEPGQQEVADEGMDQPDDSRRFQAIPVLGF